MSRATVCPISSLDRKPGVGVVNLVAAVKLVRNGGPSRLSSSGERRSAIEGLTAPRSRATLAIVSSVSSGVPEPGSGFGARPESISHPVHNCGICCVEGATSGRGFRLASWSPRGSLFPFLPWQTSR